MIIFMHSFSMDLEKEKEFRQHLRNRLEQMKLDKESCMAEVTSFKLRASAAEEELNEIKKKVLELQQDLATSSQTVRSHHLEIPENENEKETEVVEQNQPALFSDSVLMEEFSESDSASLFQVVHELEKVNRMLELGHFSSQNELKKPIDDSFKHNLYSLHQLSLRVINKIRNTPPVSSYVQKLSLTASKEVKRRFNILQNPQDCENTNFLYCNINKGCGFGCQIHHVAFCFSIAYGSNRTMVLDSKGWRYHSKGFEGNFSYFLKNIFQNYLNNKYKNNKIKKNNK